MKSRAAVRLLIVAALVAVLAGGLLSWYLLVSRHTVRNVLLISIDTCRADHLSCYGFARKTTPNIDAIAGEGVLFENAYTPVALTLPAHCSMLTGTYPLHHNVHDNLGQKLAEENTTLAELLRARGYSTGAIVSGYVLDSGFGLDQGFEYYDDQFIEPVGQDNSQERRGAEASNLALRYLEEHKDKPFFLFLHYYDPHTDYAPPEPFAGAWAEDLYSGEIAYVDRCIAQVIDKLKALQLYDSTLLVIVADHGEGLGEHGEAEHGYYIYQCTARVPFIIRLPGGSPRKVRGLVGLVDIAPTVLKCLNIPIPAFMQGRELLSYCRGRADSDDKRQLHLESLTATKYGCNSLLGLVGNTWKYIETTRPELYDVQKDPQEANNLIVDEGKRGRLMLSQLQEIVGGLSSGGKTAENLRLSDENIKRLEGLGYVGGSAVNASIGFDRTRRDAKDLIEYHEFRQKVTYLTYYKKYDEARAICYKMMARWPEIPNTYFDITRLLHSEGKMADVIEQGRKFLSAVGNAAAPGQGLAPNMTEAVAKTHQMMGEAAYEIKDYDLAVKHFSEALKIWPDWAEIHDELAAVYYNKEQFDPAIEHWQKALELKPDLADARRNLDLLMEQKKQQEKIAEYRKSLETTPDDANLYNAIAAIYYQQGKVDEAVSHWSKAVSLRPEDAQLQNALATALYSRKDYPRAIEHWSEAVRLDPNWAEVHNNLAWILATVGDEKLRDPGRALQLAQLACELTNHNQPGLLDTLGVAYAAAGRFDEAIKAAEKAIKLAHDNKQDKVADDIAGRLEMYKANKPYRE